MRLIYEVDELGYIPEYGTDDSAGIDFKSTEDVIIPPRSRVMINTHVKLIIPKKHYMLLRARSSLAAKFGLELMAGVIDCDYRDHIKVILYNTTDIPVTLSRGTKIAQGIVHEYVKAELVRGEIYEDGKHLGFGSTDNV